MAIDYSIFAIPKSRPKALDKADKVKAIASQDKAENAKAKARAKGRCEVQTVLVGTTGRKAVTTRCPRKDAHTHHLVYGIGKRNAGKSVLADWKLRTCEECHKDIHAKVLKPTTANADAASVKFWRAK